MTRVVPLLAFSLLITACTTTRTPDGDPEPAPGPTLTLPTATQTDSEAPPRRSEADSSAEAPVPVPIIEPVVERMEAPLIREAIPDLCAELGDLLGSVSFEACMAADLVHGHARSARGRPLAWTAFSAHAPHAPRILVVGGIHGDEYSSISIVFSWIARLRDEHDGARAWRLIPSSNPDGLLEARPAQRMNARGVDLNRNFETAAWGQEARRWWLDRTGGDPRRQPGPAPASEPETRWLQDMLEAWRPDVIVSVHAPHALLDFDAVADTGVTAPDRLGFLQLRPLGTYPGSLGRYGSLQLGVPVLTLELPWAGIMPPETDQTALWADLIAWINTHLPAPPVASRH